MVHAAVAATPVTFTRDEVDAMSRLWETDTLTISSLANTQYPQFTGAWQFIFPHSTISDDRDIHVDMGLEVGGNGSSGSNTGASPIVCELTNAVASQLNELVARRGQQATFRGIFRFYTEHFAERHFELHPVTELDRWDGASFVLATDYHANVRTVADGAAHSAVTLTHLFDGTQTVSATAQTDPARIDFTFPSPSVNYVQYEGAAVSSVVADEVSDYFLFRPNLVPSALVKCRLIAKTNAAASAALLRSSQAVTVNALTRTDMAAVSRAIAPLAAGQSRSFPRPIELISLGLPAIGPEPANAQLLNLSTRVRVGAGDDNAIGGFIVTGDAPKRILIRALGPSLGGSGIVSPLEDPTIELRGSAGELLAANDNWKETQQAAIEASGIPPRDERESAIVTALAPGAYTVVVRGKGGAEGVGLVELYDTTRTSDAQLGNISTRGVAGTGENVLIGGFIVGGGSGGMGRVLVRAIGPTLGLLRSLPDPTLELHDSNGAVLATNDNWRDSQPEEIAATGIPPRDDLESAIVRTLAPGSYTAVVRGANSTSGVVVVEAYNLR